MLDTSEQEQVIKDIRAQQRSQAHLWRSIFGLVCAAVGTGVVFVMIKASAALYKDLVDEQPGYTFASPDCLLLQYAALAIGSEAVAACVFFSKGRWRKLVRPLSLIVFIPFVMWLVLRISPPPQQQGIYLQLNVLCVCSWVAAIFVDAEFDEKTMETMVEDLAKLKYKFKKV
jgi:hypothetical protein